VLIKNIQQRTPLVETYIQNIQAGREALPGAHLRRVHAQRVDFGKVFFDKTYTPRTVASRDSSRIPWLRSPELTKALGLDRHFTYNPLALPR